jgi:hypothetical protein
VAWGLADLLIKEAVLEFFSRQDGVLFDAWPHCSGRWKVLEGSVWDLHWAIDACRLLDRMRFGRVHPYF